MSNNDDYIEYPLEFQGHPSHYVEYFITIKSNDRLLRFNIDSGAGTNMISNPSLRGCCYHSTNERVKASTLFGTLETRIVMLSFVVGDKDFATTNEDERFTMPFSVLNKKDNKLFSDDEYDGFLGATFLQQCDVNFRDGYIRIYKDETSGTVFQALEEKAIEEDIFYGLTD